MSLYNRFLCLKGNGAVFYLGEQEIKCLYLFQKNYPGIMEIINSVFQRGSTSLGGGRIRGRERTI